MCDATWLLSHRYLAGQKEYEVELQFSSGIIAFPDRIHTGEECRDGEEPVPGSLDDVKTVRGSSNMCVRYSFIQS